MLLLLLVHSEGRAADPALQWLHEIPVQVGSSFEVPLAGGTLADGSVMVAGIAPFRGWFARRYEPATGALLSAVMFHSTEVLVANDAMAIDAFGLVIVASETAADLNAGDVSVMKYDGRTGAPVWPMPSRIRTKAAGVDREDVPVLVRVDAGEDLIVVSAVGEPYANPYREIVITKLDGRSGSPLWGPASAPGGLLSLSDSELALDLDRNVVLTAASRNPSGNDRSVTLKIRGETGTVAWGPETLDSGAIASNTPSALAVDRSGNVFVTGTRRTAAQGSADAVTVAYDGQSGAILWGPTNFDGAAHGDDVGSRVALDAAGNVVVAVLSALASGSRTAVLKYSGETGSVLWGQAAMSDSVAFRIDALAADGAGDPIVTTATGETYAASLRIARLDGATGSVAWEVPFADPVLVLHRAVQILADPSGNPILVARTTGLATSVVAIAGFSLASGAPRWTVRSLPGGRVAEGGTIDLDADGNAVLSWPETRSDLVSIGAIAKYSAAGNRLWGPVPFEGPGGTDAGVVKSVLDANGDVFVVGNQWSAGPSCVWVVAKYDGGTGARVWGPVTLASGSSGVDDVAVDVRGDIVVTGTRSSGTTSDVATIKYGGATGAVLWGPVVLDGPAHDYDFSPLVAVDPSGNAIVAAACGTGTHTTTAYGVCMIEYSAADGSVLWSRLLAETGTSSYPIGLAVDRSGDVVLLGSGSASSDSSVSGLLVKYRGYDGGILWGPVSPIGGQTGSVSHLVIDSAGDAVVAASFGVVHGGRLDDDLQVLKYRGATGALLWGSAVLDSGTDDTPKGLTLYAGGNVLLAAAARDSGARTMGFDTGTGEPLFAPLVLPGGPDASPSAVRATMDGFVLCGSVYGRPFVARYGPCLAIDTFDLPSGYCGRPYTFQFTAGNGTAPFTWSVSSGSLPPGLTLNAGTGALSGVASGQGLYMFRVRVTDGVSATAERDYQVSLADGAPPITIHASQDPVCLGGSTTLSLDGTFATYSWLPGGETTPTLQATVFGETTYGVIVSEGEGAGCTRHGSIVLWPSDSPAPAAPHLTAPSVVGAGSPNRVAHATAEPGPSLSWTIRNGVITSGQGTSRITFTAGSPGPLHLSVVAAAAACTSAPARTTVNVLTRGSAVAFYTLEPCRLVDTRGPDGPLGGPALEPGPSIRTFALAGACGIPPTATAISANVTVTRAASAGHLRVFAADGPVPATSTLNFQPGQTRANNATVPLSNDGLARIAVRDDAPGTVHVIVDVSGYYE